MILYVETNQKTHLAKDLPVHSGQTKIFTFFNICQNISVKMQLNICS